MTRDFLIDTDTASDDAVAIIMALRDPRVVVRGITTVAGNVNLAQATRNALYVAELCGSSVPVYSGAERPLSRQAEDATWFHGMDGLGDLNCAAPNCTAQSMHAADAIVEIAGKHPGIVLVTLGPLTNIALAIQRDARFVNNVSRCVVMGGNPCCVGNVTPAAEYNIWCDPEAAQIVLRSGLPVELVGWQLCRFDAALNKQDIARIRAINTPLANFTIDCNRVAAEAYRTQTGEVGISLPDPTAMAIAIDPTLATSVSEHLVAVETQSELTRGMIVVDQLNVAGDSRNRGVWSERSGEKNAKVIWSMHVARFKQMLFKSLGCTR